MNPLHEIAKNSQEVIRFQLSEFKGKSYADVRVFYRDAITDKVKPTRKGVCVSPVIWPEFARGIERLGKELEERGLLEEKGSVGEEEGE